MSLDPTRLYPVTSLKSTSEDKNFVESGLFEVFIHGLTLTAGHGGSSRNCMFGFLECLRVDMPVIVDTPCLMGVC